MGLFYAAQLLIVMRILPRLWMLWTWKDGLSRVIYAAQSYDEDLFHEQGRLAMAGNT